MLGGGGQEQINTAQDRRVCGTDRAPVRPPSPGPLSGSSGNVGGSPGSRPAPGRWPSQRAVWECRPERQTQQNVVTLVRLDGQEHGGLSADT